MSFSTLRVIGLGALLMVCGTTASGQWVSDATVNTTVAGGGGEQSVPVVRATPDGGAAFLFFDNSAGTGYKPALQRVTGAGVNIPPGNGITLANRTNSATFSSDMKIDSAGNAYTTFDDNSSGTSIVTLQKVAPDGSLPWGITGVAMPTSTGVFGPRVVVCPDQSVVVAWGLSNILHFQRVNPDGTLGTSFTVNEVNAASQNLYLAPSDLQPGQAGGEFMALFVRGASNSATNSAKGLRMQKWDGANAQMWSGPGVAGSMEIMTSSTTSGSNRSIQNGYFPAIVPDGSGGAVVAWYDIGAFRQARLQHVLPAGTLRFAAEGLFCSTTAATTEYRLSASVAYDPAGDHYTVAYERSNPAQSLYSMAAQRIDAAGNLLWNSGAGMEIVPYANVHAASFINAIPAPHNNTSLLWIQYQGANAPMVINATQLDSSGVGLWSPAILGVSTTPSTKGRLGAVKVIGSEMIIAGWNDNIAGSTDILAQNINLDGTLGNPPPPPTCLADIVGIGGSPPPDGLLTGDDFNAFINAFANGDLLADIVGIGGLPPPDGLLTGDDFNAFIAAFAAGCP